jgi:nucleoid DNA-binding protein
MSSVVIQKPVQDIIKEMALEFNISQKSIQDVVISQFEYVSNEMRKGVPGEEESYSTIILKYFGTFSFLKKRHWAIGNKLKELKDEKHSGELQSEE